MEIVAQPSVTYARPSGNAPHGASEDAAGAPARARPGAKTHHGGELNEDEVKQLQALKARDREVRAHERAHAAAAGSLARGGPSFTTQRGPDGRMYAVGGEVQIDTSAVPGDPQATLQKALQIQRAAMAPANPSAQDRAVAASAAAMAATARLEIARDATGDQVSDDPAPQVQATSAEVGADHAPCPVCGSRHGGDSQREAVSRHFENSVTPQASRGHLIAVTA